MNGAYIAPLLSGVLSSALWPVLLPKVIEWKNRRQEQEKKRREDERETWFRESAKAYNRVQKECSQCNKKLQALEGRWYVLIEGLDDMCSSSEHGVVTVSDIRALTRKARSFEQRQPPEDRILNNHEGH